MKVFTHDDFKDVYVSDPAASQGRIEAILKAIRDEVEFEQAIEAPRDDILAVHTKSLVQGVERQGLYDIAALAAGGAIQTAVAGLNEPAFGLIRPPGHHASSDYHWGFCYFNNMAIALEHLRSNGFIKTAHILDFDLHYGDGTVNILGGKGYVSIHNPDDSDRRHYLMEVVPGLTRSMWTSSPYLPASTITSKIGATCSIPKTTRKWAGWFTIPARNSASVLSACSKAATTTVCWDRTCLHS